MWCFLIQKEQQENRKSRWKSVNFSAKNPQIILEAAEKMKNIRLYELDAFSFMMMDLDEMEKKIHSTRTIKGKGGKPTITAGMIQSALQAGKRTGSGRTKSMVCRKL